jgi:hypothetical protein
MNTEREHRMPSVELPAGRRKADCYDKTDRYDKRGPLN